ncbi:MAG: glycosyltransferase family 4 protein, partial [Planctomycetota bacterium]
MKVLYCYKYAILGGVCAQLINRLEVLQGAGLMETEIVFREDLGIGDALSGYTVRIEPDGSKVRGLIASKNFDVVVIIDTPEYQEALDDLKNVPIITEIHTTTESGLEYLARRNWTTSGYIVPSVYSQTMLRERFGVGEDAPVRVVPDSLDARFFPRVTVERPCSRPVFGWVGKLDDHKDWRTFMALAARMSATGVDAEYWLFGGETAPVRRQAEFIDECERLNLYTRCRWFPRVAYRAMHRVYAAVRDSGGAVIVTSINESFGMSVLEALVCGCPVVASRVGALPEIAPGRSYVGFYDLGNVEEAAGRAIEFLKPDVATALRKNLDGDRQWLLNRYSSEAVGPRYLDALRGL